jgi:hypothetical protein
MMSRRLAQISLSLATGHAAVDTQFVAGLQMIMGRTRSQTRKLRLEAEAEEKQKSQEKVASLQDESQIKNDESQIKSDEPQIIVVDNAVEKPAGADVENLQSGSNDENRADKQQEQEKALHEGEVDQAEDLEASVRQEESQIVESVRQEEAEEGTRLETDAIVEKMIHSLRCQWKAADAIVKKMVHSLWEECERAGFDTPRCPETETSLSESTQVGEVIQFVTEAFAMDDGNIVVKVLEKMRNEEEEGREQIDEALLESGYGAYAGVRESVRQVVEEDDEEWEVTHLFRLFDEGREEFCQTESDGMRRLAHRLRAAPIRGTTAVTDDSFAGDSERAWNLKKAVGRGIVFTEQIILQIIEEAVADAQIIEDPTCPEDIRAFDWQNKWKMHRDAVWKYAEARRKFQSKSLEAKYKASTQVLRDRLHPMIQELEYEVRPAHHMPSRRPRCVEDPSLW